MSDGGITQSSLLDRSADMSFRERNAPQDVLRGLYLSGKYAYACALNTIPLWLLAIVSWLLFHLPDVPWLYKGTGGIFGNMIAVFIAAQAFYATLQTRQVPLWLVAGVVAIAMAGTLGVGSFYHFPLAGFAAVNAEIAFLGGAAAIVFTTRFFYQLFQKRRTFGSWFINVGAAFFMATVSAAACTGVQDFLPELVMVGAGALTGIVLLLMPARDTAIAVADATN